MADEADLGSDEEVKAIERSLRKHLNRPQLTPEYNEKGEKICIDCGIDIPIKRAAIDGVVRCIDCQVVEERDNGS